MNVKKRDRDARTGIRFIPVAVSCWCGAEGCQHFKLFIISPNPFTFSLIGSWTGEISEILIRVSKCLRIQSKKEVLRECYDRTN
jgi:hypothetical protein